MKIQKKQGLNEITRFNLYPCAVIQGAPAEGFSTGQAIKAVEAVAKETLPRGYGIDWSGLSYDESRAGNEAVYIFVIVVAFVYLVLVGQYESFILPLAVILSLPVGVFGSFFALRAMGLANDVYAQIGLIMLVGLLGKNAILIVEFAVQRRQEGLSIVDAAVEGGKLRFRPIQMTSFAFIAGLLPLVVATGAGAIGNRTIGTTGVGGMLLGTVIGVLIIPGLYYIFGKIADGRKLLGDETNAPLSEVFEHHSTVPHHIESEALPFDAGPADPAHPPHPAAPHAGPGHAPGEAAGASTAGEVGEADVYGEPIDPATPSDPDEFPPDDEQPPPPPPHPGGVGN
jgi:HAE1 family hydrophobic/amphiphilic exporter-1